MVSQWHEFWTVFKQSDTPMQKTFLLYIATFVLSCSPHLRYHQLINDIPTKFPNFGTEIRFLGDSLPSKPFFEVIDIQLEIAGPFSHEILKKRLELEAIKEGVDAIIDVEYQQESFDKVTVATIILDVLADSDEVTTVPGYITYVRGIGIMYLDNLDFIQENPEFEYFYKIDTSGQLPKPFLKIEYKLTGQEFKVYPAVDEAMGIYNNYIKFYSDFHLFQQRERWEYMRQGSRITKRFLVNEKGIVRKTVTPKYDENGRITKVNIIENRAQSQLLEYITYGYDEQGRLTNRLIQTANGAKVFENWIYEKERPIRRELVINTYEAKTYYLRSFILYYHPDYLKDYYLTEYESQRQDVANAPSE